MPDCLVTIQSRCRAGKGKKNTRRKKKRQNKKGETEGGEIRKRGKKFKCVVFCSFVFCFCFLVFFFKKEGKRTISEEVCELYDKNRSLACKSSEYM